MKKFNSAFLLLLCLTTIGMAQPEAGEYDSIGRQSDLIFSGTVVRQDCFLRNDSMLVTETVFSDIGIVKSVNPSRSGNDNEIRIGYAGGTLNGKVIRNPDIPDLAVGKRYFVFVKDDGVFHPNPFPGGCKSVIGISRDPLTGGESISPETSCRPVALAPRKGW
ncbi:MAG: hypothetical protein NT040_03835 [Bacteroidetes bacterium]|nr:hypothetical protein [Bacteroidota bacterium]